MAEKVKEEKAPIQNLTCPLCLDIFDEATILTSCGHTFCRQCLKKYDLSHQDLDHMVCPLCRTITNLSANRVDDLRTNVTVNGLVDDYYCQCGGITTVFEVRPSCTACKIQIEAVSFCRTCNIYMCDKCSIGHEQLTFFFEGHEIISIQDIIEGNVSIGRHSPEKCFTHTHENKDMFCEDCKVHVCHKCVIVGHQNHKIKNQMDFEKELRLKVNDLIQRCATKKSELERNIKNVEVQRHEVHSAMQKLQEDVIQAYNIKAKRLDQNRRILIEEINALKHTFNDDLDTLKSSNRQKIKSIGSSMTLVANDRLGHFEMDSLSAHTLLCEELDGMLKEVIDHTSAAVVTEKAQKMRFDPADDCHLDLGNITKAGAELQVIHLVDVDTMKAISGMAKYSSDSVAIAYGYFAEGVDIISSTGTTQQYTDIPSKVKCFRLLFQQDRSVCITTGKHCNIAHVYHSDGSIKSTIHVQSRLLNLSKSPSDEIILTNHGKQVYIYDPTGTTLRHTFQANHEAWQAPATSSGLIVVSSCFHPNNLSMLTIHDRNGNAGESLQAPSNVYLYAAVDDQDRVYVASVDSESSSPKVVISLYDIDGLNLKKRTEFNPLNIRLDVFWGTYFAILSPDLLALACCQKLYFIKVSH